MSSSIGGEHPGSDCSSPAPDFIGCKPESQRLRAQSSIQPPDRTETWTIVPKGPVNQYIFHCKGLCTSVQGNSEANADQKHWKCAQLKHAAASDIFLVLENNAYFLRNQSYLRLFNDAALGPWFDDDQLLLGMLCGCYNERGPKRKQAYIWQCCNCGQGGISIKSEACRSCGYPRCAYCPVSKVRV
ncbi:hypothetical protein LZ30DRAFT_724346 [Colletotrichum cereale]|nr:hypothetical protein LZ30DRAFT_724346 [Colletotrichum cereale]